MNTDTKRKNKQLQKLFSVYPTFVLLQPLKNVGSDIGSL